MDTSLGSINRRDGIDLVGFKTGNIPQLANVGLSGALQIHATLDIFSYRVFLSIKTVTSIRQISQADGGGLNFPVIDVLGCEMSANNILVSNLTLFLRPSQRSYLLISRAIWLVANPPSTGTSSPERISPVRVFA